MKITPARAIRIECKVCLRDRRGLCQTEYCHLNGSGPSLKRIKEHCRDCAPGHQVEDCTGQIIGTQAAALNSLYGIHLIDGKATCPLFPYRYGKGRVLSEYQKKRAIANLRPFRKGEMHGTKCPFEEKRDTFSRLDGETSL